MKRSALRVGLGGLATAALVLAGCSANSSPSSPNPGNPAPYGAAAAAGDSTATGTPIDLVFLSEFSNSGTSADGWPGIQAAVRYVNAHGGVNGHPLAAKECVDNNDPNLAGTCAANAANDPTVLASVGQTTLQGASVDPVFEHAGLPVIGANTFVSADFTSPVVFAPTIGGLSGLGATAAITDLLHGKKIALVYVQSPAAATVADLINSAVLAPRRLPNVTAVGVSPSSGDLSATVVKATEGSPDGIVLYTGQAQANSFVKAARQQGVTTPIVLSASLESANSVAQQLGNGSNLYFYTSFNHSGPFYDAFLSQWQAAGMARSLADDFAINGWLSVTMFADVARTLPTVTRASVLAAFGKLSKYDTKGLLPPISFTTPGTALGGHAPRVVNPTMGLSQYQNGGFVPYAGGRFADPFTVH